MVKLYKFALVDHFISRLASFLITSTTVLKKIICVKNMKRKF